jgi:CRP-like cAMP-binding protein
VIHEAVATTLPLLTHQQMLTATKSLQRNRFDLGQTIIRQGELNDRFFIITQGHIQVLIEPPHGSEIAIARMGPGQFFGEVSLLQRDRTIASVKADPQETVEVVTLDRQVFHCLMDEAPPMRNAITQVAGERLANNATLRARMAVQRKRGTRRAAASLA